MRFLNLKFVALSFVSIIMFVITGGCQTSQPESTATNEPPIVVEESMTGSATPELAEATATAVPATNTSPPTIAEATAVPEADTATPDLSTANADVLFVKAEETDTETWTFQVTVFHPDTGWEDYANGWDVVLPDGTVVLPNPDDPFTRLLLHPHETEQPFTRSQSNIYIPADVTAVIVRAHDLVAGFGGEEVVVELTQTNKTSTYEIKRLGD